MARPIRAAPRLNKKESEEFVKEMHRVDKANITDSDKKIVKTLLNDFLQKTLTRPAKEKAERDKT